ncbi:taste receptor type 2 member 4-like [Pelodytes ibericus]
MEMTTGFEKHASAILIIFAISIIEFTAGLMINTFIVAVNFFDWSRGRQMKSSDKMICLLVVSRTCFQLITLFHSSVLILYSPNRGGLEITLNFTYILEAVFDYASMWFVTLLSVLYLLKIATYRNPAFLCLKRMITLKVNRFIIVVLLISVCSTCMYILSMDLPLTAHAMYDDRRKNGTCSHQYLDKADLVYYIVGNCGPFIIYSASSVLLMNPICRHMKHMRDSNNGFTTNQLDSYYAAIKSMAICFFLYFSHVATYVTYIFCRNSISILWVHIFLNTLPTLHSSYLVYQTPKLRQQFTNILQFGTDCLISRGDAGPNSSSQLEITIQ